MKILASYHKMLEPSFVSMLIHASELPVLNFALNSFASLVFAI